MYEQKQDNAGMDDFGLPPQPSSNPLAIAGFVLAFCISPLGLILSLFAAFRAPRGFAIGGIVVGALGTVVWIIIGLGAMVAAPFIAKGIELSSDYTSINSSISGYASQNNGALPDDLSAAGVTGDIAQDPFGHPYGYEKKSDGSGWELILVGPDNQPGTSDDQRITGGLNQQELADALNRVISVYANAEMGAVGTSKPPPASAPAANEAPATSQEEKEPGAKPDGAQ